MKMAHSKKCDIGVSSLWPACTNYQLFIQYFDCIKNEIKLRNIHCIHTFWKKNYSQS